MIDFSPLHKTLKEKGIAISEMRDNPFSSRTIAKINKNKDVNLSTVEKLCEILDVPIEKVVKFTFDKHNK